MKKENLQFNVRPAMSKLRKNTEEQHIETEGHKNVLAFMRPKCDICGVQMYSKTAYLAHTASLAHLKVIFSLFVF